MARDGARFMATQGVGEDGGGGNWTTVADAPHQAPASLKRGRSKLMETGYKILRSHPEPAPVARGGEAEKRACPMTMTTLAA